MDIDKIEKFLKDRGEKPYRLKQVKQAYFRDLAGSWKEIGTLGKELREELEKGFSFFSFRQKKILLGRAGDSAKALLELKDGNCLETVLMVYPPKITSAGQEGRLTVCVSSQVGCMLGCEFCATGQSGFVRDLTSEEIADQIIFWSHFLKEDKRLSFEGEGKIDNVVFMGMGEPFLNWPNVTRALTIMMDKDGLQIGQRHISVSTSGIIPGIKDFIKLNNQVNLAISLHAADNNLRSELMPINRKYPLRELMAVCRDYVKKTGRKLFFEYILLQDINDRDEDIGKLIKLMESNYLYHVNLIIYNKTGAGFKPTSKKRAMEIFDILKKNRIGVTLRESKGQEIDAACGQLRWKTMSPPARLLSERARKARD